MGTPDTSIKVGDRVRSYDFPGARDDCYVEGTVLRITDRITEMEGCDRYVIKGVRRVWLGVETELSIDGFYYAPVNGLKSVFGFMNGVVRI